MRARAADPCRIARAGGTHALGVRPRGGGRVALAQVLEPDKPMDAVPKWFLGAKLNLAENLLWANDDRTAIIAGGAGWPFGRGPRASRADAAPAPSV